MDRQSDKQKVVVRGWMKMSQCMLLFFCCSLDAVGEIVAVRHNNGVRGSRFPGELMGQLYDWYSAYYKFSNLMYDPEFLVDFKLQRGQILVFDNTRILHGRTGFDLGEGVYRYLEEVYIDWDEARSKARVIMGQNS